MRDLLTVMKFTMKEMVKRKAFIISTIIILILIVIGFNVPNIIKSIKGEDVKEKLLIVDRENIFEGNLELFKETDMGYEIEIGKQTDEEIKKKIEDEEIGSSIIIEKQDNNIKIRYIVKSAVMMDKVPEDIINGINVVYSNMQISKLGLTQEQLTTITPNFDFVVEQTDEEAHGNVVVMMLMSMVLFYAIFFCSAQVSTSITTEKTSKIMETLVTSTTPRTIILGKTLGIGIVGLMQMILIVGTALFSARTFLDAELINSALDMSSITISLGIVTIIYFILGYFEYSLLFAVTGSTVSKPEDVQSANGPVSIIAVIGFYLAYFTMMNPASELNVIASLLPISSPFCMPFRIMMGLSTWTDALISIAILLVTIAIIAKVAIKIYSSAILNYGTKISIKDMVKIYKEK